MYSRSSVAHCQTDPLVVPSIDSQTASAKFSAKHASSGRHENGHRLAGNVGLPDKFLPVPERTSAELTGKSSFKRGVRRPEASRHLFTEGRISTESLN